MLPKLFKVSTSRADPLARLPTIILTITGKLPLCGMFKASTSRADPLARLPTMILTITGKLPLCGMFKASTSRADPLARLPTMILTITGKLPLCGPGARVRVYVCVWDSERERECVCQVHLAFRHQVPEPAYFEPAVLPWASMEPRLDAAPPSGLAAGGVVGCQG